MLRGAGLKPAATISRWARGSSCFHPERNEGSRQFLPQLRGFFANAQNDGPMDSPFRGNDRAARVAWCAAGNVAQDSFSKSCGFSISLKSRNFKERKLRYETRAASPGKQWSPSDGTCGTCSTNGIEEPQVQASSGHRRAGLALRARLKAFSPRGARARRLA